MLGRSARVLTQVARECGYRPWAIDLFGDDDTRAAAEATITLAPSRDFDFRQRELQCALDDLARAEGALPLVPGSAFERAPRLLARIARRWPLLGCEAEVYRRLLDPPTLFTELRRRAQVPLPATTWHPPRAPRGWLAKRAGGSGGHHLRPAAQARAGHHYFQRLQGGRSLSASFVSAGASCRLVGFAEHLRWHPAASYRYEGARALAHPPRGLAVVALRIGMALTRELGLRGLWGFDFLLDAQRELQVVDINPRPPVTLELWSDRSAVFAAHLAACATATLLYSRPRRAVERAHLVLYADAAWHAPARIDWPRWVADRPAAGVRVPRGAPLCSLLAEGTDAHAIATTLARRYLRLRRWLALEDVLPGEIAIRSMGG